MISSEPTFLDRVSKLPVGETPGLDEIQMSNDHLFICLMSSSMRIQIYIFFKLYFAGNEVAGVIHSRPSASIKKKQGNSWGTNHFSESNKKYRRKISSNIFLKFCI